MSRTPTPRRLSPRASTFAAIAAGSLALHAVLVATLEVDFSGIELEGPVATDALLTPADLRHSCATDAALAMAARASLCSAPTHHGDRLACARRAAEDFRFELIVCQDSVEEIEAESIAFLDLDQVQIEPAPLAEVAPVEEIEAAKLVQPEPVPEAVKQAQEEMQRPRPTGQVVEITPPPAEMRPDSARFLSEYDSKVETETVARGSTEEMVERPAPRELPVAAEEMPLPDDATAAETEVADDAPEADADGRGDPAKEGPPSLLAMRGTGAGETPQDATTKGASGGLLESSSGGILPRRGDGERTQDEVSGLPGGGEAGGGAAGRRVMPNLRPSEELLSRTVGGGSVDKLDGVESGEFTALNSKKWKYATFFNRMKRQVAQNWHPDRVYMRRDPTGKIYGSKDRVTILQVSLNPNGSLAKVVIAKQSGVGFLDDEAVRAFELAGPFPNPPGGLVDPESKLITFSFGFHFQIGDRGSWRVFRHN